MGTTLTIFVGSKDPMLMTKLNMCETACCLIDTDDISKYKGYLPAFLVGEKDRVLQFSKNIFNQSSDPGFEFILDDSSLAVSDYELFKKNISEDLIDQIEDIKSKRLYQEIELQNALINFPAMHLGRKVSELKNLASDKAAIVMCDHSIDQKLLKKIKEKEEQFILIAPLSCVPELSKLEIHLDIIVCTSIDKTSLKLDDSFIEVPIIADVTSHPYAIKDFNNVYWSTSHNFLSLDNDHEKLVDSKSQWSLGRCSGLLAMSTALEIGCKEVYVYSNDDQFDEAFEKFAELQKENCKFKLLKGSEQIAADESVNFTLDVKEVEPELSKALEFIKIIEDDLAKEKEGEVLHSVLRACDYDALVKMRNGFVNYGLINYQESDFSKKKSYYLSLIEDVREILKEKDLNEYDYRQKVSDKFSGKELFWDFEFELKVLAHANPRLAMELQNFYNKPYKDEDFRYSFNHKFSVDLNYRKNDEWQKYSSPDLEFVDHSIQSLEDTGILIIPGVLDGKVQLELFEMYEEIPIITLINRPEDLAELLKYVPLISILGRRGLWINGSDEDLAVAYKSLLSSDHIKPLLIDIDPKNEFPHIAQLKKGLDL